jgi:hypothetical protein
MAIDVKPVLLLPTLDSERFENCAFSMHDGEARLTITMQEIPAFVIHFRRLCWHRFTPAAACTPILTEGCHMAVAEVARSPALRHHVMKEKLAADLAAKLHHYRVYLGPGGCHEAFAEAASLSDRDGLLATWLQKLRKRG